MNGAPIIARSNTQKYVTLSTCEAEGGAGIMVAQDMLYTYRLLGAIGLKVELPMVLEMDNKGAVDMANNWSVGGRSRHVDVRNHFLRQCKEDGLLVIRFVPGADNDSDILTKNVAYPLFKKHVVTYVGNDKYLGTDDNSEHGG